MVYIGTSLLLGLFRYSFDYLHEIERNMWLIYMQHGRCCQCAIGPTILIDTWSKNDCSPELFICAWVMRAESFEEFNITAEVKLGLYIRAVQERNRYHWKTCCNSWTTVPTQNLILYKKTMHFLLMAPATAFVKGIVRSMSGWIIMSHLWSSSRLFVFYTTSLCLLSID